MQFSCRAAGLQGWRQHLFLALGSALGGVAGSFGIEALGLPHVFFIPAGCALLAVAGLAAMAKAYPAQLAGASLGR